MAKTVLLIGTLDTKAEEYGYLARLITERGHRPLLLNAGVFPANLAADIEASEVAVAGGRTIAQLREQADRGEAVMVMQQGVAKLTQGLFAQGRIDAVLALGGSAGTTLACAGMRVLPVGLPKLMVSTLASGDVAAYVGHKDISMMYSVVDIAGINRLSRQILNNAVGMICGALEQPKPEVADKPLIAATMFGVTTPCVMRLKQQLEQAGYELLVFHATGSGGQAMEALITEGTFDAVADVTTTEWADTLVGGVLSAGEQRLEAAARVGVPQVVSLGALDMVNFWAPESVPEEFKSRRFYRHNDNVTLMRTSVAENQALGQIIASKLNKSTAATTVLIPLRGISMIDAEGQPFYDPEADQALFAALRDNLNDHVKVIEVDAHINDEVFADRLAAELLSLLKG